MTFCSKCGSELVETAVFCGTCGTKANFITEQLLKKEELPTSATYNISDSWQKKFTLIEKAGGVKLSKARELTFTECSVIFNVWGFFFGPFYYVAKGMWKKGIVLTGLCVIAIIIFDSIFGEMGALSTMSNFIAPAVFATRANIDYYKKVVLGDNGWW